MGGCDGAFGDVCTFACDNGYTLSDMDNIVWTCGQDGIYSGTAKTCDKVIDGNVDVDEDITAAHACAL